MTFQKLMGNRKVAYQMEMPQPSAKSSLALFSCSISFTLGSVVKGCQVLKLIFLPGFLYDSESPLAL